MRRRSKLGQQEIMGFVIIIVIVSVILLILLSFLIRQSDRENVENYEIESFLNAILQSTSECEGYTGHLSIQKLIIACDEKDICLDKQDSCKVLDETIREQIKKGWNIGEESAIRGYDIEIFSNKENVLSLQGGNITSNFKGDSQDFARRGINYEVILNIYY